jgi:DNA topoisomerase-1
MEIIIALVVFGGILWFYYSRDGKKSDEVVTSAPDNVTAPYKVPEPAATTPIPLVVEAVKPVKAKAPAKPRAPAKAPAKAKAPAATKAKAPAKPRAPKAKPTVA